MHWWLTSILEITLLKRIDLCMDFHDDYLTVNSARLAYKDMGFRRSTGKYPKCRDVIERDIDGNILGDTFYVGSRESLVFGAFTIKLSKWGVIQIGFVLKLN